MMNKYVKMLMQDLGVEVEEKININGYDNNPCHFNTKGYLINSLDIPADLLLNNLLFGQCTISKIEVLPNLTEQEIGMLKGFKIAGYRYIASTISGTLVIYDKMKNFKRREWENFDTYCNLRKQIYDDIFNTIMPNSAYTIDELLKANEK